MTPTPEVFSRLNLYTVLHSLPDGVTLANAEGRIVFSNSAADRILGVGAATEATADEWSEHYGVFLPDGETPFPTDQFPLLRALRGEHTQDVEMLIRNPSNREGSWISVSGQPLLDEEGRAIGAAVVFRDITLLRKTQQRLQQTIDDLTAVQAAKNDLVGFVAHDIKSPLSTIVTSCDLLELNDLDEQAKEDIETIRREARRVNRLALDMLDVQLAEDGALALDPVDVAVAELLNDVEQATLGRIGRDRRRLEVSGDEGLSLHGDRSLLFRTVMNLVDNCLKYGPADGVIRVGAGASGDDRLLITVSDEGPGVPEHMREQIFDKYAKGERLEGQRTTHSRGLGLRFCKVIAEAHGGSVWVENAEPRGARFCLELPRG